MTENFVVIAEARADQGKGASRRLRRAGNIPAIIYGGTEAPQAISVSANEMGKHLKIEAFYSHILQMKVDGTEQQVVLKDLQRHPVTGLAIHADFLRVQAGHMLTVHVPLHFKGETIAPGVKTGGGIVEHHTNQVDVECLPKDLPEFIEIDLSNMQVNDSIHLSQLTLPAGVTLVELKHGNDAPVVSIHKPRGAVEADAEGEEGDEAEGK